MLIPGKFLNFENYKKLFTSEKTIVEKKILSSIQYTY